jgi:hypothetical protein
MKQFVEVMSQSLQRRGRGIDMNREPAQASLSMAFS